MQLFVGSNGRHRQHISEHADKERDQFQPLKWREMPRARLCRSLSRVGLVEEREVATLGIWHQGRVQFHDDGNCQRLADQGSLVAEVSHVRYQQMLQMFWFLLRSTKSQ